MIELGGFPRDAEVESFVDRYLVSFAAWDLIVLLHAQPDLCEGVSQLAYRLGRSEHEVARAVDLFAIGGVVELAQQCGGEGTGYRLLPDPRVRSILDRFMDLSAHKEWRLELVRRVLMRLG